MAEERIDQPLVAVVIPALDEILTIRAVVQRVQETLRALDGVSPVVIVIDDGSSDGTGDAAVLAGADRVIRNSAVLGLGAAVRAGIHEARRLGAEIVVKIDADSQHSPEDIPALLHPIMRDEADLVFGDRFHRISYRMPPIRRLGNHVFSWLLRRITGWPVRDSQPGIFAGSKRYLEGFRIPDDYNYTQQVLIDGFQRGLRFHAVPVAFRERTSGTSFVSFRYLWKVPVAIGRMLLKIGPGAAVDRAATQGSTQAKGA